MVSPHTVTDRHSLRERLAQVLGPVDSLRGQLVRGGLGSLSVKVSQTVLLFLLAVLLARVLGPNRLGVFAFVQSLVILLAIPARLGLPELVVRETAKAQANQQWGVMRGLWRWCTAAVLVFSIFTMFAAVAAGWLLADRVSAAQFGTLAFGLLLIPLIALGNLRGAALRGLHRVVLGQLPESIIRPGLTILLVVIALVALPAGTLDSVWAMALLALASALAFGIGVWFLWRAKPNQLAMNPTPIYHSRSWVAAAVPLALLSGLQLINQHAGILVLGSFRSAEEVGIFKVVVTGATLVSFGLNAVNQVVAPHFARLYAEGNMEKLQQVVTHSARVILALAVPVVFALVFAGGALLTLFFGSEYATGHVAIAIIAIGQLINAGMGSVGALLNMTGHERDTLRGVALAAGANILLCAILIPPFGIEGAAVANALTLTLWNLVLRRFTLSRLQIESVAFFSHHRS